MMVKNRTRPEGISRRLLYVEEKLRIRKIIMIKTKKTHVNDKRHEHFIYLSFNDSHEVNLHDHGKIARRIPLIRRVHFVVG